MPLLEDRRPRCPLCNWATKLDKSYLEELRRVHGVGASLACRNCGVGSCITDWLKSCPADWTKEIEVNTSVESLVEHNFRVIMGQLGLDTSSDGLKETPNRVARFLMEFNQECDLIALLKSFEHEKTTHGDPMVVMSDIPLAALCEHHFCPFLGTVDIGYLPNGRVVGLSKLARLVRAAGHRRPTVQERLTDEIADALQTALEPKGVIVIARAQHTCMSVRGIQTPNVTTTTSSIRGVFVHNPTARSEFLSLVQK